MLVWVMIVAALTPVAYVKRMDVIDSVGNLLAYLELSFTIQRPEHSATLKARAQEREDEAVVCAVGTLCGEPGLDVKDVWMGLVYSAIVF